MESFVLVIVVVDDGNPIVSEILLGPSLGEAAGSRQIQIVIGIRNSH